MKAKRILVGGLVVLAAGLTVLPACNTEDDDDSSDDGTSTGGSGPATGGAEPAGGGPSTGAGGSGASAAQPGSGGDSSGGAAVTGGAQATGGTATGGTATGGAVTGGAVATGGAGGCDGGPLSTSLPNCEVEVPAATGDYHQDCVDVINAWRWQCQCLPPLERWTEAEACADQMAEYDYGTQEAHSAFRAGACDPSGRAQCECPGWGSAESITHPQASNWGGERESCLEMMWHEVDNPAGEQGHYEAMSNTSYARVACGIYVAPSGEVWALQNYDR